ncbi:MAG: penicillin-binding transpeptidase domain-containing protein [bacterium]
MNLRIGLFLLLNIAGILSCPAQNTGIGSTNAPIDENPKPSWETQKQARTFQLGIPAPRGQITDRNGYPFAQSRLSYNLALQFPTPLNWNSSKVIEFARQQITFAKGLLSRPIAISEQAILNHYKNRGLLPLTLLEDLQPEELAMARRGLTSALTLQQVYARFYPNGELASHIIGYTGKEAPLSIRPIENKDLIFTESEGREGIEQTFDFQLKGQPGNLHVTYDADGNKSSERIAEPPVPGDTVITTLDQNLQRICEKVLKENCKRGAIVMIDPWTGEIHAMASWPEYNPNHFVPILNPQIYKQVSEDPNVPLLPRAYRSAYPPGSTFKTFVGLSGFQSGKLTAKDTYSGPTAIDIGNVTFHNWKKVNVGKLNFVEALTQSCNTWFIQAGLKIGAPNIIEWTNRLGLGKKSGIPLKAESKGSLPSEQKHKLLKGDIANMSIGQGILEITPLQMAQAYGAIATGGQFHQTRLVKQIQSLDNKVIAAYPDRLRDDLQIKPEDMETLREALIAVTEDGQGTAHLAQVKGTTVAGKTGTAQWGGKSKETQRTAAWFAGFVPAENPQYAFAAVYEGEPGDNSVHGGSHAAPLIGKVLKEVYGVKEPEKKDKGKDSDKETDKNDKTDDSN